MLAILVTNLGRALFVPPMVAWLGDLFPATQRSQANAAFSLVSGVAAIPRAFVSGVLFEHVGRAAPFVLVALGTLLLAGLGVLREPPPVLASCPGIHACLGRAPPDDDRSPAALALAPGRPFSPVQGRRVSSRPAARPLRSLP